MRESVHFTQAFEIAQLEEMGMEKNSTGKGKIIKSLLSHCNNGHLSQWPYGQLSNKKERKSEIFKVLTFNLVHGGGAVGN